jgi:Fe-S oxidoreductase
MNLLGKITVKTGLPVPVNKEIIYKWAFDLNLPRNGEIYLYTGGLYQLIPYINSTVEYLSIFATMKNSEVFMKILNRLIDINPNIISSLIQADKKQIKESYEILKNITELILKVQTNVSYLYEDDIYSGVLLYDMGLDDYFSRQASTVYKNFLKRGVKKVIVIDPHTTYILKEGYPRFIDNFNLEVINYIELLSSNKIELKKSNIKVTIHDPCYYSRYNNIVEQPRMLLRLKGIEINEVKRSKRNTFCCGGPLEAFSPKFSHDIAKVRIEELSKKSNIIVTMCPICKANLSRVNNGLEIKDLSQILLDS